MTATRLGISPSKLLIPLCFGAHAGSQLALTGSNVNLLVSDALLDYRGQAFGFFEFALVGVPLLLGTVLVVVLLSDRLLPVRTPQTISADLSRHARTLVDEYSAGSGALGRSGGFDREIGLAEVIIPPRSPFVGERVFQGMTTESGDLVVAAIRRKGEDLGEKPVDLAVGDALLLQGPWEALDAKASDPGVLVVDHPEVVRRQAVPFGLRAWESIGVLVGMVVLLVTGPRATGGRRAPRGGRTHRAPRRVAWSGRIGRSPGRPSCSSRPCCRSRPRCSPSGAADLVAEVAGRRRRWARSVRVARRAVRRDRDLRPAHQQHRDGPDHDPDRRRRVR